MIALDILNTFEKQTIILDMLEKWETSITLDILELFDKLNYIRYFGNCEDFEFGIWNWDLDLKEENFYTT